MTAILSWLGLDWATLLGVVLGFFGDQLRAWLAERRAEQAREDLGRTKAERDGAEALQERSDQQTARAANPPTDDEIGDRLKQGLG